MLAMVGQITLRIRPVPTPTTRVCSMDVDFAEDSMLVVDSCLICCLEPSPPTTGAGDWM